MVHRDGPERAMLKKRLIPKLLLRSQASGDSRRHTLVTTRGFAPAKVVGNPVSQAKIYEAQLADELAVLRIDPGPISEDLRLLDTIERLATETFMPLTVGGGVVFADDFQLLLSRGADKVAVNSAAIRNPSLISEAAGRFGAQCVVISIDFRDSGGRTEVCIDRGRTPTGRDPVEWAREAVRRGAGEILLCDIDRDGSGAGLNLDVGSRITEAVDVPVILSGGCGRAEHLVEGFLQAGADAVAAGTYFCLRDQNPLQARSHVANAGVPIRMGT
ncbi:MAG: imidazole glycerol phosphate synthase subunit HisF [Phycisphaerales bacterium]